MSIPWFMPTAVSRLSCAPGLYRSNTCAHARKPTHVLCRFCVCSITKLAYAKSLSSPSARREMADRTLCARTPFREMFVVCFISTERRAIKHLIKGTQTTNQRGLPKYHTGAFSLRISRIQTLPQVTHINVHPHPTSHEPPHAATGCSVRLHMGVNWGFPGEYALFGPAGRGASSCALKALQQVTLCKQVRNGHGKVE